MYKLWNNKLYIITAPLFICLEGISIWGGVKLYLLGTTEDTGSYRICTGRSGLSCSVQYEEGFVDVLSMFRPLQLLSASLELLKVCLDKISR